VQNCIQRVAVSTRAAIRIS